MRAFYLRLPFVFFAFWFWEAPAFLIRSFFSINHVFLELFSLPLLIKTFFKPLKNEYRKGLVGFSIGMGIAVKSMLIFIDILIISFLLLIEIGILAGFILLPFFAVYILFL